MSERRKLAENELGKVQLYQRLMSMEFSLLTAYVALFLTTESIALALTLFLKDGRKTELGIVAITSIVLGIAFLAYLYRKAHEVERWKNKILELTKATDMEDDFKPWKRLWFLGYRGVGGPMALIWVVPLLILLLLGWYLRYYIAF